MAHTHVLRNPLANPDQPTPSRSDSISPQLEAELRLYGGLLIQQAGILLKLPQVVMATAATLFQRFYFVTSFLHFGIRDVSAGSLFLAAKLEEKPARIRDIINVYDYLLEFISWSRSQVVTAAQASKDQSNLADQATREAEDRIRSNPLLPPEIKTSMLKHLKQKSVSESQKPQDNDDQTYHGQIDRTDKLIDPNHFKYEPMGYFDQKFYDRKEEIVVAEMQILKRLGFHVQVQHPYSVMVNYLQVLNLTDNNQVAQRAWNYLNDSLLTPLPALYPPSHLATLSIYLSVQKGNVKLPKGWWELFDVSEEEELEKMSSMLNEIYGDQDDDHSDVDQISTDNDQASGKEGVTKTVRKCSIWIRVSHLPCTKEGIRKFVEDSSQNRKA